MVGDASDPGRADTRPFSRGDGAPTVPVSPSADPRTGRSCS